MLKLKVNDIEVEVEEGLLFFKLVKKQELKFQDFVIMKNYQLLVIAECV